MPEVTTERGLSWYAAREPLVLLLLSAMAVGFFFFVTALSRAYAAQRRAQANIWFTRGANDLRSGEVQRAVNDFHVALSYSRENYDYQVSLAQALLALNRGDEASTYLLNLWQRQPENGTVNLALARIFASKGDVSKALRYYHNAVYAIWGADPDAKRRLARLELIDFLLRQNQPNQAEAELIALTGNLTDDPSLRAHVGDLFMQVPDYDRALALYRESLKIDPKNQNAIAGETRAQAEIAARVPTQQEAR